MYKVRDLTYPSALYTFQGDDIKFHNYQASVPDYIAYRMARVHKVGEFELEDKVVPYNPDSWKKDRRIIWNCNYASANGFGNAMENIAKQLLLQGVTIQNPGVISNLPSMGSDLVDPLMQKTLANKIEPDCLEIQYCQPPALRFGVTQRIWTYAMFETTHMPQRWVNYLNRLERILVPASFLVDLWKEQGVTVPISVFHHGIDPEKYYYLDRPNDRKDWTFITMGQLSERKGTDLVTKAFLELFDGKPDAKLICKTSSPLMMGVKIGHPQIEVIHAIYNFQQLRDLYQRSDIFVFPTRGEGFGFPPIEAMATGLPVIVTDWSGPEDYINKDDTMIVNHTMTRAHVFDYIYKDHYDQVAGEHSGYWAEPNYEQIKEYMWWSYTHREEAREMGRKAAERMVREWTWEVKVKGLIDFMDTVL